MIDPAHPGEDRAMVEDLPQSGRRWTLRPDRAATESRLAEMLKHTRDALATEPDPLAAVTKLLAQASGISRTELANVLALALIRLELEQSAGGQDPT